mgnify:CR=1 FL=1
MSREMYKSATMISSASGPTGNHDVNGFGIYVGGPASGTGSVACVTAKDGRTVLFNNVPAGSIIPVWHTKILGVTGTTAEGSASGVTYATTSKDIVSLS